jgi:hypothetical protein
MSSVSLSLSLSLSLRSRRVSIIMGFEVFTAININNRYLPWKRNQWVCSKHWCLSSRLDSNRKKTAWPLKMGPTGSLEKSVVSYRLTLGNIPKERRPHLVFPVEYHEDRRRRSLRNAGTRLLHLQEPHSCSELLSGAGYMIYLLTAIGLPPGGSSTVHIYTQTIHRTTQKKIQRTTQKFWKSAVRVPSWRLLLWHLPYHWEKSIEKR